MERLEPRGLGDLQKAFEKLKTKLAEEGLFKEEKKKLIPQYPWKVGIITSATGAAVRDILNIIKHRIMIHHSITLLVLKNTLLKVFMILLWIK